MLIFLSLLVAIIGLVMYFITKDKPMEVGRLMFACGLLAFLLKASEPLINLLGGR